MTTKSPRNNPNEASRPRDAAADRAAQIEHPRKPTNELDESELELVIQASSSRIFSLALAQSSLEGNPENVWEEGR